MATQKACKKAVAQLNLISGQIKKIANAVEARVPAELSTAKKEAQKWFSNAIAQCKSAATAVRRTGERDAADILDDVAARLDGFFESAVQDIELTGYSGQELIRLWWQSIDNIMVGIRKIFPDIDKTSEGRKCYELHV